MVETLRTKITESVQSGQAGIWVRTHEPDEALNVLTKLATDEFRSDWELHVWDAIDGLRTWNAAGNRWQMTESSGDGNLIAGKPKPSLHAVCGLTALASERQKREALNNELPEDSRNAILVLRNGHREICNNGVTQKDMLTAIQSLLRGGKAYRCHLVILSFPGVDLPLELQEQFWVVDHELPDREDRKALLIEMLEGSGLSIPDDIDDLAMTCGGLTLGQTEGVAALSMMKHGAILAEEVWKLKADTINKRNLLSLYRGEETFADLGGLDGVKQFCYKALRPGKPEHVRARAILLLGIPGTGKSAFAKALGNEKGRVTLTLDIGRLMGGLVGQTEEATREALRIADAMEPCLLFIDEVEKSLGGRDGEHDGGVSSRLFGSVLTWLNDHTSDVFFVCTANNVSKLPPEFTRAERFDAIFFMDLPSRRSKDAIWDIYLKFYGLDMQQLRPDDDVWTGAEIKTCCRLAALFDATVLETAKHVIPVVRTAKEQVDRLREWAAGRCLDAETGSVYTTEASPCAATEKSSYGSRRTRRVGR